MRFLPILIVISGCVAQPAMPSQHPLPQYQSGYAPPYPPYERHVVTPSENLDAQQWATHRMHQGEMAVCQ